MVLSHKFGRYLVGLLCSIEIVEFIVTFRLRINGSVRTAASVIIGGLFLVRVVDKVV